MVTCLYFFFFKQKTAYEMRISDWSSDVCSSDLHDAGDEGILRQGSRRWCAIGRVPRCVERFYVQRRQHIHRHYPDRHLQAQSLDQSDCRSRDGRKRLFPDGPSPPPDLDLSRCLAGRSEEHTSELQSLMRISYTVL